jgi:NAD(P)-dependent dehydrogenase (short-subunit alcohol dehydrogenase family)
MKWTSQDCSLLVALVVCCLYPLRLFSAGGQVPLSLLKKDLSGQLHLITGVSANGIGYETALQLAKQNASLLLAVRNVKKGKEAADAIRAEVPWPVKIEVEACDLASFASVRSFADRVNAKNVKFNSIVANAGVMAPPHTITKDGFELQFQSNHLSHFLLVNLLANKVVDNGRIVILSSRAHEEGIVDLEDINFERKPYSWLLTKGNAYANSKLANVLHARGLAKRLKSRGITAVSLHPGVVSTNLFSHIPLANELFNTVGKIFAKTPREGAQTTLYTLLADKVENGAYYADCKVKEVSNSYATEANVEKLWQKSEQLTNSKLAAPAAATKA